MAAIVRSVILVLLVISEARAELSPAETRFFRLQLIRLADLESRGLADRYQDSLIGRFGMSQKEAGQFREITGGFRLEMQRIRQAEVRLGAGKLRFSQADLAALAQIAESVEALVPKFGDAVFKILSPNAATSLRHFATEVEKRKVN